MLAPARKDPHDTRASDEWDALEKALAYIAGKTSPQVGIEFRVLVADSAVESYISGKGLGGVSVRLLDREQTLMDEIRNYAPHVIHVHGDGVSAGGSHVELAHTDDIDDDEGGASIHVDASDLLAEVRSSQVPVWMVVLNCCETSANPGTAWSIAHDLIRAELPLAVGMSEEVDALDCHAFAGDLYPHLIDLIDRALAASSPTGGVVEWAPLLRAPRQAVRERTKGTQSKYTAACTNKSWTFPCLYAFPDDFHLQRPTMNSTAQAQAQAASQSAAMLRGTPGVPRAVLNGLNS